jgi:hypothetical protein
MHLRVGVLLLWQGAPLPPVIAAVEVDDGDEEAPSALSAALEAARRELAGVEGAEEEATSSPGGSSR